MEHSDEEPIEPPATWENVVAGKAKEVIGRIVGDKELAEQGEEQEAVAHEVRDEFKDERTD